MSFAFLVGTLTGLFYGGIWFLKGPVSAGGASKVLLFSVLAYPPALIAGALGLFAFERYGVGRWTSGISATVIIALTLPLSLGFAIFGT